MPCNLQLAASSTATHVHKNRVVSAPRRVRGADFAWSGTTHELSYELPAVKLGACSVVGSCFPESFHAQLQKLTARSGQEACLAIRDDESPIIASEEVT